MLLSHKIIRSPHLNHLFLPFFSRILKRLIVMSDTEYTKTWVRHRLDYQWNNENQLLLNHLPFFENFISFRCPWCIGSMLVREVPHDRQDRWPTSSCHRRIAGIKILYPGGNFIGWKNGRAFFLILFSRWLIVVVVDKKGVKMMSFNSVRGLRYPHWHW